MVNGRCSEGHSDLNVCAGGFRLSLASFLITVSIDASVL